jgi:hypothetical protein
MQIANNQHNKNTKGANESTPFAQSVTPTNTTNIIILTLTTVKIHRARPFQNIPDQKR